MSVFSVSNHLYLVDDLLLSLSLSLYHRLSKLFSHIDPSGAHSVMQIDEMAGFNGLHENALKLNKVRPFSLSQGVTAPCPRINQG